MVNKLLNTSGNVTLVGGGPFEVSTFECALNLSESLVAADGGAAACLAQGKEPDLVIGDLDSLPPEARAQVPPANLHHITEQDSTDFEKSLSRIDAPLVYAVGFTGGRLDHELAVYNALVRHAHRRCIVLGDEDLCLVCPPELTLSLPMGTRVSLFPMGAVQGRSEGLNWPIEGLTFAPDGTIGTSNHSTQSTVQLSFEAPKMLLILERAHLEALEEGLKRASGWPEVAG